MKIDSEHIYIYPVSDRTQGTSGSISQYGYLGKLNIEQNIINQKNNLVDNISYSLSKNIILDQPIVNDILTINEGRIIINSYSFDLLYPIKLSLLNYKSDEYYVYFKINLEDKQGYYDANTQVSLKELSGKDISNTYTGLSVELTTQKPQDTENTFHLVLGKTKYSLTNGWSFDKNPNLGCAESFTNMQLTESEDLGLFRSYIQDKEITIDDWLNGDEFIIDDGIIGENI